MKKETLTENDLELIRRADELPVRSYWKIDDLIPLADTDRAREYLYRIRYENYDICVDSN